MLKKEPQQKLPPLDNSFTLHGMPCCYQLLIWKTCGTAIQDFLVHTEFRYESYEEVNCRMPLRPILISQATAPPELMNVQVCKCSCFCNEQPCTTACMCKAAMPLEEQSKNEICLKSFTISSCEDLNELEAESDSGKMTIQANMLCHDTNNWLVYCK